jgi:hypothetical protein
VTRAKLKIGKATPPPKHDVTPNQHLKNKCHKNGDPPRHHDSTNQQQTIHD